MDRQIRAHVHAALRACEDSELEGEYGRALGPEQRQAGACIVRTATALPRACAPNARKVCLVVDVSVGMDDEVADDGSSRAIDSLSVEPNATSSLPPIDAFTISAPYQKVQNHHL